MAYSELIQHFQALYGAFKPDDGFHVKKPLLAHYTSISSLENILKSKQIWFSNPLLMNDVQEVRYVINHAAEEVLYNDSSVIADACQGPKRFERFRKAFSYYFDRFANADALDMYVFCLAEHDKTDRDGLLSMWRGYGGNGKGVAIVFDTAKLNVTPGSPLVISRVIYGSSEDRAKWVHETIIEHYLTR